MTAGRPPRVLVVEDDRTFADLLAEILEEEGYAVDRAYDGAEAIGMLRGGSPPDLVLSDVMMPKLSGTELVAAARDLYPPDRLPFLLLSAGRNPALAAERVWFMAKPVDFDQLLDQVRTLIDGHADRGVDPAGDGVAGWMSMQNAAVHTSASDWRDLQV